MRQSWQGDAAGSYPRPAASPRPTTSVQFRIYGLPPGEYYVSASLRSGGLAALDMESWLRGASPRTTSGTERLEPRSGYAATYYRTANVGERSASRSRRPGESSADFALVPFDSLASPASSLAPDGKPLEGARFRLPSIVSLSGMLMQAERAQRQGRQLHPHQCCARRYSAAGAVRSRSSRAPGRQRHGVPALTSMAGGDSDRFSDSCSRISGDEPDWRRADDEQGRGAATGPSCSTARGLRQHFDPHLAVPVDQTDGPVFGGGSRRRKTDRSR